MITLCNALWLSAEQEAKSQRVDRLVLLTTRTADWFEQRGFQHAGPAHASPFLPDGRRQQVGTPLKHDCLFSRFSSVGITSTALCA